MGQNLTGQTIASTYEDLVQISGSILTDGLGNDITSLTVTSSFATTASFALNVPTVDTGSLMVTGSVSSNTLTFTKGDGSTFDLTVATGSAVTVDTGSLLVTASISDATITLTKGDASTFDITVNNVQNASTASIATSASYAQNASTADSAITAQTASYANNFTVAGTLTATSASITYLETIYETASVIYSSGSNQFGDASNDVQTLYGTVDLKNGPLLVTGSVISTGGFTGSLLGTASYADFATSASYAATASFVDLGTSATAGFTGSTWVFNHNLNADYVVVDCYDANEEEIIPQTIDLTTVNQATITFPVSVQGTAVASLGNGVTIASITNNITNVTQSFTNTNPLSTLGYNLGVAYTASLYTQRLEITAAGTYSLDVSASGPHYIDCTGLASGTAASVNVYVWADAFANMSANEGAVITSEAGAGSGTYISYRTIVTASAGTEYWSSGTSIGGSTTSTSRNATLPRRDWGGGATNPWVISKTLGGDVILSNGVAYQNTIAYKYSGNQGTPI